MKIITLFKKIKNKGLIKSFSIFINYYVYTHWQLYVVERPLDIQSVKVNTSLTPIPVSNDNLHIFKKYFNKYIPSIKKFLEEKSRPEVYADENGDAYAMMWVHEGGDYHDNHYYKCTIPVPKDSIYFFAGDIAKDRSSSRIMLSGQQRLWNEYHEKGFKSTRAVINANNPPAIKIALRLGFTETGTIIHIYRFFNFFSFARYETYSGTRL